MLRAATRPRHPGQLLFVSGVGLAATLVGAPAAASSGALFLVMMGPMMLGILIWEARRRRLRSRDVPEAAAAASP